MILDLSPERLDLPHAITIQEILPKKASNNNLPRIHAPGSSVRLSRRDVINKYPSLKGQVQTIQVEIPSRSRSLVPFYRVNGDETHCVHTLQFETQHHEAI